MGKIKLYHDIQITCESIQYVHSTVRGTCAPAITFKAVNLDMGKILNELVSMFGEKEVIEWITEKKYNPLEHT